MTTQQYINTSNSIRRKAGYVRRKAHAGFTLIELIIGMAIGLLTVTAALGTLVISSQVSSAVSETSQLQQQAAYAFRVIGQQARQASSRRLNLSFGKAANVAVDIADPVAFDNYVTTGSITGKDTPGTGEYKFSLTYQNYTESVVGEMNPKSLLRDCLGQQPSTTEIQNNFVLVKDAGAISGELRCAGTTGGAQAIISKVADMQVRYLLQDAATAAPTLRYATPAVVGTSWQNVYGIEVCLELVGDENIHSAGATYRDCNWQTGDAEKSRGDRLHMVFRNTYQMRSKNSR